MTLIDLLSQLRAGGLFPIRVESIHELSDDVDFIGSLSEYIEAAKAVQSSYVLVSSFALSEDHFISNNVDVDVDDEEGVEVRIDLCRLVPELGKFKTKIGEDGHIDLSVPMLRSNLTLVVVEDWMVDFVALHTQAQQLLVAGAYSGTVQKRRVLGTSRRAYANRKTEIN